MLQILRLARRDGDEWVRLFASVLAPFPNSQTISVEQITEEGGLEGIQEEISEAREYECAALSHTPMPHPLTFSQFFSFFWQ